MRINVLMKHLGLGGTESRIHNVIRLCPEIKWKVLFLEERPPVRDWGLPQIVGCQRVGLSELREHQDCDVFLFYAEDISAHIDPAGCAFVYTAGTISELTLGPIQACPFVKKTIAVSHQLCKKIPNSVYIPTGVDTDLFSYRHHGRSGVLFGYFGRVAKKKRVHVPAGICNSLGVPFAIVGGGECLPEVLESNPSTVCHGPSSTPELTVHSIDCNILFSLREGQPNAVLEAAAAGVPTIATPVGDLRETFQDRETIWFVDSERELRERMEWLLHNPKEVSRVGFNARKLVERTRSLKRMVEQYKAVFEEALR